VPCCGAGELNVRGAELLRAGGWEVRLFVAGAVEECGGGVNVCQPPIDEFVLGADEFRGAFEPRAALLFVLGEPKLCQPGGFDRAVVDVLPRGVVEAGPFTWLCELLELLKVRAPPLKVEVGCAELLAALREL
jgi:hypothetical protein